MSYYNNRHKKQHWDLTVTQETWDKAPTVREIDKLDYITYFGKFSKLSWEKKQVLFFIFHRLSNSSWWYQHLWILLRLFYQILNIQVKMEAVCLRSSMRSLNRAIKTKKFLATLPAQRSSINLKRSDFMPDIQPGTKNLNPKCPALIKYFIQLPGT